MTNDRFEHAPLVESWLSEPVWLPETDTARVAQLVHQTAQRRRWLPQIGIGRFQPMFDATKLVVGGIVVALASGLLFSGVLPTGPSEQAAPAAVTAAATQAGDATTTADVQDVAPKITLPDEIPEGARRGSIDTPLGRLDWVHIPDPEMAGTVTGATLPGFFGLHAWGDLVAVWGGRELWKTSDGVRWESVPFPPDGGPFALSFVGDTAVLATHERGRMPRVWVRASDATSWDAIDTSAASSTLPSMSWGPPQHTEGSSPELRPGDAIASEGRVVVPISTGYRLPLKRLGIPRTGKYREMRRLAPDLYALCGGGSCPASGSKAKYRLRFKETDRGLHVTNERTGRVLGHIDDATLAELYEGESAESDHAFAVEGDALVPIDLPPMREEPFLPNQLPPPTERDSETPPDLEGVEARPMRGIPHGASYWLAVVGAEDEPKRVIAWIGNDWVSLDDLELPTDDVTYSAGRAGDLVVLSPQDPAGGSSDLRDVWLLQLPEGA